MCVEIQNIVNVIEKLVELLVQWMDWEMVKFCLEEFDVCVEDLILWDDFEVV